MSPRSLTALGVATLCVLSAAPVAQVVDAVSHSGPASNYGAGVAGIGDLDGDGVPDLAVGSPFDGQGGFNAGAVHIRFMNADGTPKSQNKIVPAELGGLVQSGDLFGWSVVRLDDLDGNPATTELAVGLPGDDGGEGSVIVLFLDEDGDVSSPTKISVPILAPGAGFGTAVGTWGSSDLVVGAPDDDDGQGQQAGAIYTIQLTSSGGLATFRKVTDAVNGLSATLDTFDKFGVSVCALDGRIVVGALGDDDGGSDRGAFYVLSVNSSGEVTQTTKFSDTTGGFDGLLSNGDRFGCSVAQVDGYHGGSTALAVGAYLDDTGGSSTGALWLLSFGAGYTTVVGELKLGDGLAGIPSGALPNGAQFGFSVSALGDLDGECKEELAVGAPGSQQVWVLDMSQIVEAEVVDWAAPGNLGDLKNDASGALPWKGTTWRPYVESFLANGDVDVLFVGVQPTFLAVPPYGTLIVNLANTHFTFSNTAHGAPFDVPIPAGCEVIGYLYCQAASFDDAGNAFLSDGLRIVVGNL